MAAHDVTHNCKSKKHKTEHKIQKKSGLVMLVFGIFKWTFISPQKPFMSGRIIPYFLLFGCWQSSLMVLNVSNELTCDLNGYFIINVAAMWNKTFLLFFSYYTPNFQACWAVCSQKYIKRAFLGWIQHIRADTWLILPSVLYVFTSPKFLHVIFLRLLPLHCYQFKWQQVIQNLKKRTKWWWLPHVFHKFDAI